VWSLLFNVSPFLSCKNWDFFLFISKVKFRLHFDRSVYSRQSANRQIDGSVGAIGKLEICIGCRNLANCNSVEASRIE
jgi:hypothetical protein